VRATLPGREPLERPLEVGGRDRLVLRLALPAPAAHEPTTTTIDMGEDGPSAGAVEVEPDPRPKQHASLLPDRYRGGATAEPGAGGLVDPEADRAPARRGPGPASWIVAGAGVAIAAVGVALLAAGGDEDGRRATGIGCLVVGGAAAGVGTYLIVADW
jgi:hypothetical protein